MIHKVPVLLLGTRFKVYKVKYYFYKTNISKGFVKQFAQSL